MPWGEKQAFKYVVDGEWKVREDEAKEWDAAGNMNNVYTAPHAPEPEPAPAAAAVAAPSETTKDATTVPPTTAPDSPPPTQSSTEPSALLAASAPAAASGGVDSAAIATPEKIEQTAATTNVGAAEAKPAATTGEHEKTLTEQAAEYGAGAAAALGAVVGAVGKATGLDLGHSEPISVEEARAKGIDVDALEKKDAPTDTTSPAGTIPSTSAVDALDEKVKNLDVQTRGSSLPDAAESKVNDLPAQSETTDNHTTIPAPQITPVSPKDPSKDRTLSAGDAAANSDTAGTQPISKDPAVDAKAEKKEAEANPLKAATSPAPAAAAPATPAKPSTNGPAAPPKDTPGAKTISTISSTPAKTPASAHTKDASGGSSVNKRKSSFFHKLKSAFSSPKDQKEKK